VCNEATGHVGTMVAWELLGDFTHDFCGAKGSKPCTEARQKEYPQPITKKKRDAKRRPKNTQKIT